MKNYKARSVEQKAIDDIVMTPRWLAKQMIDSLPISGKVLDPCRGSGAFYDQLPGDKHYCEIAEGLDFYEWNEKVNWIVTNPPWGNFRNFNKHAMEVADNTAFLITINHELSMKARIRDMQEAGFGIRAIYHVETPKESGGEKPWPQMGFQLGWVWKQRGYKGPVEMIYL